MRGGFQAVPAADSGFARCRERPGMTTLSVACARYTGRFSQSVNGID